MERQSELQAHVAFHLTGNRPAGALAAVEGLRPALLAQYRDLTALRYDFPVVLVRDAPAQAAIQSLSAVVDGALREIASKGSEGERTRKQVLRIEREIRALAAAGAGGALSALWDKAAGRLAASAGEPLADSLKGARAALKVEGEVLDCNDAMPERLLAHTWRMVQVDKSRKFLENTGRLILKLSNVLGADQVRSEAGRSAQSLKASVGSAHAEVFDFEAMSRLFAGSLAGASLPGGRRNRIRNALSVLKSQRFFAAPGAEGGGPYSFVFDSCTAALQAFRSRVPDMVSLAKAITIAELESEDRYVEAQHDPLFRQFGENALSPGDLAGFPDYLVCVSTAKMDAIENAALIEMLSSGLPFKVLVQIDDILAAPAAAGPGKHLASMAIGLHDAFVLQSAASNLFQLKGRILSGLAYPGAALFSVYTGAPGGDLPAYLACAVAAQSRAFPAFTYDPSAGPDFASRFSLEDNPQVDADWPVQQLAYEDKDHQRVAEDLAFTFVDFAACDPRYAGHFAKVPQGDLNGSLVPVGECLARQTNGPAEKVPYLLMVDQKNSLERVIVDEKVVLEARRCVEAWHRLQELGGIRNSHVQKALEQERKTWEERLRKELEARAAVQVPAQQPQAAPVSAEAPSAAAAAPAETAEPEKSPDEPYIETPRCSTCNECTQLNDRMFAYNENKQAYIKNLDAGTYRELVEAAESCQVSIIHPGKPRNPDEPGLEELLKRAEPFL